MMLLHRKKKQISKSVSVPEPAERVQSAQENVEGSFKDQHPGHGSPQPALCLLQLSNSVLHKGIFLGIGPPLEKMKGGLCLEL